MIYFILLAVLVVPFVAMYVERKSRYDAERECYNRTYLSDEEIMALKRFRARTNRYW